MKTIFKITMIAILAFISCSEEQEELIEVTSDNFELNTVVKEYENSLYYEQTKKNGLDINLESYRYEEVDQVKMILFDVLNQETNNAKTKVVALLNVDGQIRNSFSVTTTKPFDKNYSGDAIIDLYNGEVLNVSFKNGQVLSFQLYDGAMRMMPNGDPSIEGDGGGIGDNNGDDPIELGCGGRGLGICVGNTIENMSPVEGAFCYVALPSCAALIVADCIYQGCPFDGV